MQLRPFQKTKRSNQILDILLSVFYTIVIVFASTIYVDQWVTKLKYLPSWETQFTSLNRVKNYEFVKTLRIHLFQRRILWRHFWKFYFSEYLLEGVYVCNELVSIHGFLTFCSNKNLDYTMGFYIHRHHIWALLWKLYPSHHLSMCCACYKGDKLQRRFLCKTIDCLFCMQSISLKARFSLFSWS